jgi:hypothetical protein
MSLSPSNLDEIHALSRKSNYKSPDPAVNYTHAAVLLVS